MADPARLDELQRKYADNPRRYFAPLANEYRKAGELSTAVQICRDELARFPGHMSGHVVLGQALYESRRPTEAQAAFERALALDPENLIALRHLGDIARERGDLREARAWYERVLEADPRNDDIAAQLSRLAPSYGRPAAAPPAAPVMPPVVPDVAPPAMEAPQAEPSAPVLEPLEWTALDLDIPGAAASGDAETVALPPAEAVEAPEAPEAPEAAVPASHDTLLDFDPAELAPLAAPAEAERAAAVEAEGEAGPLEEPFDVISDEVTALAGGPAAGVEEAEPAAPEPARTDAPVLEPEAGAIADAPVDQTEQELEVPAELEPAAVLRWDDLLPSLDEEEETAAAAVAEPVGESVTEPVAEPDFAAVGPETPDEPETLLASDGTSEVAEVVEPELVLAVEAGVEAPQPAEAPVVEAAWPFVVEGALDIDAAAMNPPEPQPAADATIGAGDQVDADEVDAYDFLIPFEASTEPVAQAGAPVDDSPAVAAPAESEPVAEAPVAEQPVADEWVAEASLAQEPIVEPAFFAAAAPSAYDPVVGLDLPPAPPVPAVLAEAAPESESDDADSPAPVGAFVTETMAELLAQQGHLERALDVYAQLVSQRPYDEMLRERADALRARLQPLPAEPEAEPDASPNAAAFFASLAFDAPPAPEAEAPPAPTELPVAAPSAPGFFDAPAEPEDERAAARLARAVGAASADTESLVAAIFDAPPREPASPASLADTATFATVPPPAEAPYGLAEFSFERFFAGLEEGSAAPDGEAGPPPAAPAPADDAWAALATPAPAESRAESHADARTDAHAPGEAATAAQPQTDDEDLAQFNAWLKGLIGP